MNANDNRVKVIIDTDPGIDDAFAILLALTCKEIDVIAITITHGNHYDTQILAKNASYILDKADRTDIPIYIGPGKPLMRKAYGGAEFVHGIGCLGGIDLKNYQPKREFEKLNATQAIVKLVEENKGNIKIIALGSLTNLAISLQLEPSLTQWSELHIMGGAFAHVGNRTPLGEANIVDDPEAAKIVLGSDWKIFMSPLNVTHKMTMNEDYFLNLAKLNEVGKFIELISRQYLKFSKKMGSDHIYCHDPTAVFSVIKPDLFTDSKLVKVTVLTVEDISVGMTVCDLRKNRFDEKANVTVLLDIDVQKALDFYRDQISTYSK
eukprot:TRINITY_DN3044_c1_g1_i1.p1 TRINITY_DN3044_c1_g1~~TRINITY_DN3044_c1_g1_i1.p1  ORF type:complete len:321 (-),score=79.47 TRINITY_DN3044_c1_g1_i1:78-1040(-)